MRIAMLDGVQPSALTELDDIMEKQFAGKSSGKRSALGGAKAAADIVNVLDPSDRRPAHGADHPGRRSARRDASRT